MSLPVLDGVSIFEPLEAHVGSFFSFTFKLSHVANVDLNGDDSVSEHRFRCDVRRREKEMSKQTLFRLKKMFLLEVVMLDGEVTHTKLNCGGRVRLEEVLRGNDQENEREHAKRSGTENLWVFKHNPSREEWRWSDIVEKECRRSEYVSWETSNRTDVFGSMKA